MQQWIGEFPFGPTEDVLTLLAAMMNALKRHPLCPKFAIVLMALLAISANLAAANEPTASPEVTAAMVIEAIQNTLSSLIGFFASTSA